ncbi:hypothetical protein D3C84_926480 [compost metagenome]
MIAKHIPFAARKPKPFQHNNDSLRQLGKIATVRLRLFRTRPVLIDKTAVLVAGQRLLSPSAAAEQYIRIRHGGRTHPSPCHICFSEHYGTPDQRIIIFVQLRIKLFDRQIGQHRCHPCIYMIPQSAQRVRVFGFADRLQQLRPLRIAHAPSSPLGQYASMICI